MEEGHGVRTHEGEVSCGCLGNSWPDVGFKSSLRVPPDEVERILGILFRSLYDRYSSFLSFPIVRTLSVGQ